MQHSLFDRIYLSFLIILISSFGVLIIYISVSTKKALVSEKSETLTNEASLIASQTIAGYLSTSHDKEELIEYFNYYSKTLNADIWYADEKGIIIATSDSQNYKDIPKNIFLLDPDYKLNEKFSTIGTFYNVYPSDVISVNVPIIINKINEKGIVTSIDRGSIIIHASSSQIDNLQRNIFSIILIPCLFLIVLAFIFISIISKKVIQPVKKLNVVAAEYSRGNFDVKTGIDSKNEIGSLAKSMEYMADGLSKLEEYRRDFISNISHDFRSPLTSIKGYITAMLDGTIPPEKQERYLNICLNETNRLTKLTSGLLDMNKLTNYGPYLNISTFDIIDVIKSTINTFEIKCIEKNIALFLNNHAMNTYVIADKTKIQQVIYNLIDNAIKFTPSGKKIYVSVIELNEKLYISVKDEGIGMSKETQNKIWIRFYKEDTSRGKDKQGTGLGLAIAKEIMKAHNENITVVSTEGAGSEFTFSLTKGKKQNEAGTSKN